MTIVVTDPAVGEAVTLAEAKGHLRVETDAEDGLIEGLVRAAREHLEAATGLSLLTRGFRLHLDDWPKAHRILLRRHPVHSIDAVTVYDEDGMPQAVDLARLTVDLASRPARLAVDGVAAPGRTLNGIEIEFTAGFGETGAEVPDGLKRAMLTHVALMYELRGGFSPDQQPAAVPAGYDRLIAPYARRAL